MTALRGVLTRWLLASLAACAGCGGPELPPGGRAAVEYWHRVLVQHPDLPGKVQAIVDGLGGSPYYGEQPPATEVRIYGEHGEVAVSGSRIQLIITDLDTPALRELLAVWKHIPSQAAGLGLDAAYYDRSAPRRQVVVLGSGGHIEIRGVGDSNAQLIRILSDEAAASTTIGIHTFGTSGTQALEELTRNYQAVRGPPKSEVASGHVSLPPPEDAITVLVIGKLRELDIGSAYGDALQEISVAAYVNEHQAEEVAGMPAGRPYAERLAQRSHVAQESSYAFEPATATPVPATPYVPASSQASGGYAPVQLPGQIQVPAPIYVPTPIQMPAPWTPPQTFNPPVYVPPPVFRPTMPVTPPVRFR